MAATKNYVAFDLGAESGRAIVGRLGHKKLTLEDVHRFPNGPVRVLNSLHWDVLRLWSEMKQGLAACAQKTDGDVAGIGVDTWGVDFGLVGRGDVLLGNPYHYRDSRTDGMLDEAFKRVPRDEIFRQTGIQFMQINTLFQLLSMVVNGSPLLDAARTLLMIPDLLNFMLTGRKASEFTIATTSQAYDPRQAAWAKPLFEKLGIPLAIMPEIIQPGTEVGPLLGSVADEAGLGTVPVIAPPCHDTASAVAAVPAQGDDWAYISSGTWSLMGAELAEPIINDKSLEANFTNEGGVGGTFRFLKNIMGLWLVQECKRTWARAGEDLSYDQTTYMAASAKPFQAFVDPDDPSFVSIGDMPGRIQAYCEKTGQRKLEEKGDILRCALESLALTYRLVLDNLESVLGRQLEVVHIVGGGTQNKLLCQFAADAMRRPVVAGPVEATAIGNVMMQAIAQGEIASIEEGRELVGCSFEVSTYQPAEGDAWDTAYERFKQVIENGRE